MIVLCVLVCTPHHTILVYILYEYPTKVPNTQIRFWWTSCRGTMHQTLITDRGRPKNRYPYNLSVRVSCAKPVGLSIEFAILQPFGLSSIDRDIPIFDIFAVSPTDTQTDTNRYPKAMTNLSGKPSGQNSFGLHYENPYLQPFFPPASMDQVYVCLVSFSMLFIHVVCLAVSLFLFAGYLSSWANTAKQVKRNNVFGIRRLRSKMQAASR